MYMKKASGVKINLNKTVGMYLGRWKNKTPKFKQIKWSKDSMKVLGQTFYSYKNQ